MKDSQENEELKSGTGNYLNDGLLAMGELRQKLMSISMTESQEGEELASVSSIQGRLASAESSIDDLAKRNSTPRESYASCSSMSSLGILPTDFPNYDKISTAGTICEYDLDLEGRLAREKALRAITIQDLRSETSSNTGMVSKSQEADPLSSATFGGSFSFPSGNNPGEVSGFSEVLGESDIRRDESWCAANFNGLPIKPNDISLTGITSGERMSMYFNSVDNSFLSTLGPMDPPRSRLNRSDSLSDVVSVASSVSIYDGKDDKENWHSPKPLSFVDIPDVAKILTEQNSQRKSPLSSEKSISKKKQDRSKERREEPLEMGLRSDEVRERMSRLDSVLESLNSWSKASSFGSEVDIDAYLSRSGEHSPPTRDSAAGEHSSPEVLRVSEIAELLKEVPADATPVSLAKKVMDVQYKKLNLNIRDDSSSSSDSEPASATLVISSDESGDEVTYNAVAVFGAGTQVEITPETPSSKSLWNIADHDSSKIIAKVKQDDPSLITVLLLPLVNENMILTLQEIACDMNESVYSRTHKINLAVETPKVFIVGVNNGVMDFGCVPECSTLKREIKLTCDNSNMIILCPKFVQDGWKMFGFEDDSEKECNILPGTEFVTNIVISPKHGTCRDASKTVKVNAVLEFDLLPIFNVPPLFRINIKAEIFNFRLQSRLENDGDYLVGNEDRKVLVRNASPCSIKVNIATSGPFMASLSQLSFQPNSVEVIPVRFIPPTNPTEIISEGKLMLISDPGSLKHGIVLRGRNEIVNAGLPPVPDFLPTPSTSSSVNSSFAVGSCNTSSDGVAESDLQLECTLSDLVWSSRSLGAAVPLTRSTCLRSKGKHREKLLVQIEDPTLSYQLVTKDGELKQSMVVTLSSMQRKEVCVQFAPQMLGQLRAYMTIRRVNSDIDTRKIHLYGFGGYGHLRAEEVSMDLENKSFKIPLAQDSLDGHFVLRNVGDGTAFFNITQRKVEGMYLKVTPERGLIEPGEKRKVSLCLSLDRPGPSLVEHLLQKDKTTDVILSSLNVVHGDNSTRMRIARLYRKYRSTPELTQSLHVSNALSNLCNMLPIDKRAKEGVSKLKDPLTSVWCLFEEGIHEWMIQVIIPRKALEDIMLDTTQMFTTITNNLDETENTTMFDSTSLLHSSRF